MFFEGTLNDGIAAALKEQKLVVCFVRDNESESLNWESWLQNDQELTTTISTTSVLLNLTAGGQEASYLSAFCPISSHPALIVIRGGVPAAHLKPGLTEDEFKTAVMDAVRGDTPVAAVNPTAVATPPTVLASTIEPALELNNSATQPTSNSSNNGEDTSPSRPSESSGIPTRDKTQKDQAKRVAEVQKAQSDALSERRRVLAQIENDKKERKLREQEQRRVLRAEEEKSAIASKQSQITARKNHKECALKIRTFDGSTISKTFPSEQKLQQDVRPWIDSELGTLESPYEFRLVLAPLPNRKISTSEEDDSLRDLGLAPSATLVMVPVQSYSSAYASGPTRIVGSTLSYGYGLVSGGLGLAGSLVGSALGRATAETAPIESNIREQESEPGPSNTSNTRVRTLADQRRKQDDQQLYNGNQLNFERRKDDKKDE